MRPHASLLLVVLLAAGGSFVAPAADAATRSKCRGGATVRQNSLVRVYSVFVGGSESERVLYGCRKSTGRKMRLARSYDDDYVASGSYSNVRLNGWHVAFEYTATDISCKAACPPGYQATSSSIEAADVRLRRLRSIGGEPLERALVVTRTGGVAWVQPGSGGSAEVRVSDKDGARVVDSGSIAPRSLRVELTIISWTRDGVERFARLR